MTIAHAVERVSRAELGFQFAQDGAKEAEQELQQLEMMYQEDEFADKTKEIVLERGRRRLERSKRSLAIETDAIANRDQLARCLARMLPSPSAYVDPQFLLDRL